MSIYTQPLPPASLAELPRFSAAHGRSAVSTISDDTYLPATSYEAIVERFRVALKSPSALKVTK